MEKFFNWVDNIAKHHLRNLTSEVYMVPMTPTSTTDTQRGIPATDTVKILSMPVSIIYSYSMQNVRFFWYSVSYLVLPLQRILERLMTLLSSIVYMYHKKDCVIIVYLINALPKCKLVEPTYRLQELMQVPTARCSYTTTKTESILMFY